jgi:hypothetical protein
VDVRRPGDPSCSGPSARPRRPVGRRVPRGDPAGDARRAGFVGTSSAASGTSDLGRRAIRARLGAGAPILRRAAETPVPDTPFAGGWRCAAARLGPPVHTSSPPQWGVARSGDREKGRTLRSVSAYGPSGRAGRAWPSAHRPARPLQPIERRGRRRPRPGRPVPPGAAGPASFEGLTRRRAGPAPAAACAGRRAPAARRPPAARPPPAPSSGTGTAAWSRPARARRRSRA